MPRDQDESHTLLEQSWQTSPSSIEPRRNLRPRFAGTAAIRKLALLAYREFQAIYREARVEWQRGAAVMFPRGTYWLARFAPVAVEAAASS